MAAEDVEWVASSAAAFFEELEEHDVAAVNIAHAVLDTVETDVVAQDIAHALVDTVEELGGQPPADAPLDLP